MEVLVLSTMKTLILILILILTPDLLNGNLFAMKYVLVLFKSIDRTINPSRRATDRLLLWYSLLRQHPMVALQLLLGVFLAAHPYPILLDLPYPVLILDKNERKFLRLKGSSP
jgi:hypothetical protein